VDHVHLLSARVGIVMKTYRRANGENFEQERNECASPLIVRPSRAFDEVTRGAPQPACAQAKGAAFLAKVTSRGGQRRSPGRSFRGPGQVLALPWRTS
jgi:hypothetical protein